MQETGSLAQNSKSTIPKTLVQNSKSTIPKPLVQNGGSTIPKPFVQNVEAEAAAPDLCVDSDSAYDFDLYQPSPGQLAAAAKSEAPSFIVGSSNKGCIQEA